MEAKRLDSGTKYVLVVDNQALFDKAIELGYPYTALLGVLKRIGAPKKASYETADMFMAQHGNDPCTAYELYLAMSEIIFDAQCDGASGSRIAQLEEIIARALSVNWGEYDRPGDFKW